MKGKVRILGAVLFVALLCFGILAACASTATVEKVTIKYDGKAIANNELIADIYEGTSIEFTVDVEVIGDAAKTYTLTSATTSVATVGTDNKTVTLVSVGSTVLTATSTVDTTKKHSITLTVEDNTPPPPPTKYAVTVTGGTADKATAEKGETVTLTVSTEDFPDGKEFSSWSATPSVVFTGNTFVMPEAAVTITAVYKDKAKPFEPAENDIPVTFGSLKSSNLQKSVVETVDGQEVITLGLTKANVENNNSIYGPTNIEIAKGGKYVVTLVFNNDTAFTQDMTIRFYTGVGATGDATLTCDKITQKVAAYGETVWEVPVDDRNGVSSGANVMIQLKHNAADDFEFTMKAFVRVVEVAQPGEYGYPVSFGTRIDSNFTKSLVEKVDGQDVITVGLTTANLTNQNTVYGPTNIAVAAGDKLTATLVFNNPSEFSQSVSVRFYTTTTITDSFMCSEKITFTIAANGETVKELAIDDAKGTTSGAYMMIQIKNDAAGEFEFTMKAFIDSDEAEPATKTDFVFGSTGSGSSSLVPTLSNGNKTMTLNIAAGTATWKNYTTNDSNVDVSAAAVTVTFTVSNQSDENIKLEIRAYDPGRPDGERDVAASGSVEIAAKGSSLLTVAVPKGAIVGAVKFRIYFVEGEGADKIAGSAITLVITGQLS